MLNLELEKIQKIYRRLFNSEDGKFVLRDLRNRCYVDVTAFDRDPYVHAFNEGVRSFYLTIVNLVEMDLAKLRGDTDASQEEG